MKSFACTLSNKAKWQKRVEDWLAQSGIDHRQLSAQIGKDCGNPSVSSGWTGASLVPDEKCIYLNPRWRSMSIEKAKFMFFHELGHYKYGHTFNSRQYECKATNFALECGCRSYPPSTEWHTGFINKRIQELDNPTDGVV